MEPRLVHRPAFTIVGARYNGTFEDNQIPALWANEFVPRLGEIRHRAGNGLYGMVGVHDSSAGEWIYVAGVEVLSGDSVPDGMISWSIPEQTYAVFPTTLATLSDAFHDAETWLSKSGYQRADGPQFEYYDEDFQDGERMYLYIPIVASENG